MRIFLSIFFICCLQQFKSLASVFDTLMEVPGSEKQALAYTIFDEEILRMDSADAVTALDQLAEYARNEQSHRLEALALNFKGRYFDYKLVNGHVEGIKLMRKAVNISQDHGDEVETARFLSHLGFALCKQMEYKEGLELLLVSNHKMEKLGYENVPEADVCLYKLARVYVDFENYDKAIHFTKATLKYGDSLARSKHAANNLLGVIYAELGDTEQALFYFEKALHYAELFSDSLGIGSAICNLGIIYCSIGDTVKSAKMLNQAFGINSRNRIWMNTIASLLTLAEIDLAHHKTDSTLNKIARVRPWMEQYQPNNPRPWQGYYDIMYAISVNNGNYKLANMFRDSSIQLIDSIRKKRDIRLLSNLSVQVSAERYLSDIQLLEKDKTLQKVIRNALLAIAGLVIFILSGLWVYAIRKRKKERSTFLRERERAMHELEGVKRRIKEKNRLIEDFRNRLEQLSNESSHDTKEEMIKQFDEFIILTEEDWHEFKKSFDRVYPDFLMDLQLKYPELTLSEARLLALIKLNLSVSEMANTLGILPQSVRKTRQRLMKKLHIEHHKDIPSFVARF